MSDPNPPAAESPLATVYRRSAVRATRYAVSIVGDLGEAEEIVHDAFCRLLTAENGAVSDPEQVTALLFVTIRRRGIDVLRKRNRRRAEPLLAPDQVVDQQSDSSMSASSMSAGMAAETDEGKLRRSIAVAMAELPEKWADALRLRVDGGLSYDQISAALNCTRAQVRTWIYRGRRQLEEDLRASGVLAGKIEHE